VSAACKTDEDTSHLKHLQTTQYNANKFINVHSWCYIV